MNITVPRYVVVALGAVFSAYQLILAASSLQSGDSPGQVLLAMMLYAAATYAGLFIDHARGKRWAAIACFGVALALPPLVTSQLPSDGEFGSDYSTWHVGAVGVLMVIISARGFHVLAWLGVGFLVVHTVLWAGPGALGALGVFGSVLWVAVSHVLQLSLAKADRDARTYATAEREAAEWRIAQEAHISERSFRLGHTARVALPMLRLIVDSQANLTDEQKHECLLLEGAIRDEIRGRSLLDDAVREQVMAARRRGATVTLLDEGGLDDIPDAQLSRVRREIAHALRESSADAIIIRSVPDDSRVAVTVVGLVAQGVNLLGAADSGDDAGEVDMWLEIPRYASAGK